MIDFEERRDELLEEIEEMTGAGQGIKKARRPSSGTKAAGATMIKIALRDLPYRSSFSITRR